MRVKKIQLDNFRNYEKEELEFHEKVNIILGNNAQGKTNLLESIFITSLGKSFRTSKDAEMIRFNQEFAKVVAEIEKKDDEESIEIIISDGGKAVKVDETRIKKISELLENVYTVIFSPEDLKIVKDEPEKRRRFINRELSQLSPLYYTRLLEYNRILKQRNAFLKEDNVDKNILDIWDIKLAKTGAFIMMKRRDFVKKLSRISSEIHGKITGGSETLCISYASNVPVAGEKESLDKQEEILKQALAQNMDRDIFRRNTSKGPHKDDLKITVNNIDLKSFGSQGQQRTAALSLKLAELKLIKEETGEDAILLLDDVLSELDASRQSYLINSLNEVQLFITTTEIADNIKETLPKGKTFYVDSGKIVKTEE